MSEWNKLVETFTKEVEDVVKPRPKRVNTNNSADTELVMAAMRAAITADQARDANAKARDAKKDLELLMFSKNVESISMPDRDDIVIKTTNSKKVTKKAISDLLGESEAAYLWGKMPNKESKSLSIPNRREIEPGMG
jgi:hypothetical protein